MTTPRSAHVAADLLGLFVCMPIFGAYMIYWFGVAVVSAAKDARRGSRK